MFGTDLKRIARFAQENPEVKSRVKIISSPRSLSMEEVEGFPNLEEIHSTLIVPTLTVGENLKKLLQLKNLRLFSLTLVDLSDFFPRDRASDSSSSEEEEEDEDFAPEEEEGRSRWLRKRPLPRSRRPRAKRARITPGSQSGINERFFSDFFPRVAEAVGGRLAEMEISVTFLENMGFSFPSLGLGEDSETESEIETESRESPGEKKVLGLSAHRFVMRRGFLRCYPQLQPRYRPLVEALAKSGALRGIFLDGECHPTLPKALALRRVEMTARAERKTRALFLPRAEEISLLLSGEAAEEEPETFLAEAEKEILQKGSQELRELAVPLTLQGAEEALSRFPRLELCGARLECQEDCAAASPLLQALSPEKILTLYRAADVDATSLLSQAAELGLDIRTQSLEILFSPHLNGELGYLREPSI